MARVRSSKPAKNAVDDAESGVPVEHCLLVQDEIWRVVSDAAENESFLSLGTQAQKIAEGFPAAGFSLATIADALVYAAVDCGAAFEMPRPSQRQAPAIDVPGFFALVGGRRKSRRGEPKRPTFAGVPIPVT